MTDDALVLPRALYPPPDDPTVRRLLERLAAAAGTAAAELELRPEGSDRVHRYAIGAAGDAALQFDLVTSGRERARLRLAAPGRASRELVGLASLALETTLYAFRLHRQTALLRGALDSTTSAVLLFDSTGDILYANPPADRLLSRQTEHALTVVPPGGRAVPLFDLLCSLVERISVADPPCPPWLGTLALSDRTVLACEVLRVSAQNDRDDSGVLALLQTVTDLPDRCRGALAASYDFSPREEEVVRLLQEGLTAAAIADRLGITGHTVRDHLRHVYRKTGTGTRRQLLGLLQSATLAPPLPTGPRPGRPPDRR